MFMLFLLLSFICFVLGIVVLLKGSLKRFNIYGRKNGAFILIGSFVLLVVAVITSPSSGSDAQELSDNENAEEIISVVEESVDVDSDIDPFEEIRNFSAVLSVDVIDDQVKMIAETNVPDGGIFEFVLINGQFDVISEYVPVSNGFAEHLFSVPEEWNVGYLSALASFHLNLSEPVQPANIQEIYGSIGEYMTGEMASSINDGGHVGNVQPVTFAYPSDNAVRSYLADRFNDLLDEFISSTDGVVIDVKPSGGSWKIVDVIVGDAWYYSADHEKERFAESVSESLQSAIWSSEMVSASDPVSVYFYDSYGKELATPKIFGGYNIKR